MIEPAERQQMILDIAQAFADKHEKALRRALDEGWGLWTTNPPSKRRDGYDRSTMPADRQWVLTENYLELWRAGVLPPLQAVQQWQAAGSATIDPVSGQMVPPPTIQDLTPYFWAILLSPVTVAGMTFKLPDFVFEKYTNDFRSLVKAQVA